LVLGMFRIGTNLQMLWSARVMSLPTQQQQQVQEWKTKEAKRTQARAFWG
jgi:hypothetical protein